MIENILFIMNLDNLIQNKKGMSYVSKAIEVAVR